VPQSEPPAFPSDPGWPARVGNGQDSYNECTDRAPVALWPKALSEQAYHGIAGEIVKLIEPQTEADPASLLFHLLVFCGNCAGNSAWVQVEATRHYPNLFTVIVGDTSKARKGTAERWARRILRQAHPAWEQSQTACGLSTGEGLIERVRDPRIEQKFEKNSSTWTDEVVDPGVSDKRLLVVEEELARPLRVMGRPDNTLSAVLRQAWDGSSLGIMTRGRPIKATGALISLIAHITITELRSELAEVQTANGFGNRCLFVCSKRSKLLPFGGRVDVAALDMVAARLRQIFEHAPQRVMEFDRAAAELWIQEYERLSKGGTRMFDALTARAEAQVLRVAIIYALLDQQWQIGLAHLQAALELIRYSNDSVRHIWGDATGNRGADTILRALRRNPDGMSRAAIYSDLFGRHSKADEIGAALGILVDHALVRSKEIQDERSA
jgi:hypothetical protein